MLRSETYRMDCPRGSNSLQWWQVLTGGVVHGDETKRSAGKLFSLKSTSGDYSDSTSA